MTKHDQSRPSSLSPSGRDADQAATTIEAAYCDNCGTALAMCVYWKIHGYVACCPECQHRAGTLQPETAAPTTPEAT